DVVWIAYVDLVMVCMYLVYFLVMVYGWPVWIAGLAGIGLGVALGLAVHVLIITPILSSPPINQLLATGGLLFFIQSFATFPWTRDHRPSRNYLPVVEGGGLFLSFRPLIPFALSIVAMLGLGLFLRRPFIRTAIRAVAQDRGAMALMGADPQRV